MHADDVSLPILPKVLESAIENVLRNAIRYTPIRSVVDVALRKMTEGSTKVVVLTIEDQGPGVPEDSLNLIFEPFYKVEMLNTPNIGTGVGMAIASKAMELHCGRIWAENINPGLKIHLELPLD